MEFKRLKVPELKQYLKARGISCYFYNKPDLIRLCELADELKLVEIDDTCMEVDFADMDDCRRTITLESGEKQILPNIVDITSWSKDLSDLPDVNYCDILVYFMNICLWSEQRLTKYKEDEGYKLFTDTHIDYVTMHKVDHNYCYIKSVCTPQDRQNDAPYITWVLVHEEGRVKAGGCNCVANNGTCKHCVALLFALVDFCDRHKDRGTLVGTDIVCVWDKPRKASEPRPLCDIPLKAVENDPKKHYKPISNNNIVLDSNDIDRRLIEICAGSDASFLQFCDTNNVTEEKPFTIPELAEKFPLNLQDNIKSEHTQKCIDDIEKITRGQYKNSEWFRYRQGRITASLFYSVLHFQYERHDENNNLNYITKQVLSDCELDIQSPAIKHGKTYEPIARQCYLSQQQHLHNKLKIKSSGLLVDKNLPFIAASPDGIVTCKCCGTGLLEIKCSYKFKDDLPVNACNDKNYHLCVNDNGIMTLKATSPWYAQIQGQLGVANLQWCDFVFYTFKGIHCQRIYFDQSFFDNIMVKCSDFFAKYVEKELVSK